MRGAIWAPIPLRRLLSPHRSSADFSEKWANPSEQAAVREPWKNFGAYQNATDTGRAVPKKTLRWGSRWCRSLPFPD
jgi:hypothetical protein